MNYKKIALIGMMGCGKSEIGKKLSQKININCYEADEIFEKEYSIKIKDFFKKFGEQKFREFETEILKKIILKQEFVISCGGGVILKEENRKILSSSDILTIFLKTDPKTIYDRIKNDTKRPLLQVENPENEIKKILSQRQKYYEAAKLTIITDNKSPEEIVEEIINYG